MSEISKVINAEKYGYSVVNNTNNYPIKVEKQRGDNFITLLQAGRTLQFTVEFLSENTIKIAGQGTFYTRPTSVEGDIKIILEGTITLVLTGGTGQPNIKTFIEANDGTDVIVSNLYKGYADIMLYDKSTLFFIASVIISSLNVNLYDSAEVEISEGRIKYKANINLYDKSKAILRLGNYPRLVEDTLFINAYDNASIQSEYDLSRLDSITINTYDNARIINTYEDDLAQLLLDE